ncbi:IcmT/TraK family protein [Gilliamella sp. ESL0441]|uniref:IcmT/TraK family protein n=1 Tax=Gilliamella sp. ESL0441 TaxID=2704654 RepID=UPI00351CBA6F
MNLLNGKEENIKKKCIWRHASKTPKLMGIPCISYISLFAWLLHMRMWTFLLSLIILICSALLAKFGITLSVFIRQIQHYLRGSRVTGRPWWYRNRFRGDFKY